MDSVVIAGALGWLTPVSTWVESHLLVSFYLAALVHLLALSFVQIQRSRQQLTIDTLLDIGDLSDLSRREKRKLWRKQNRLKEQLNINPTLEALSVVAWIFAIGGVFWLLIPGFAIAKQVGSLPPLIQFVFMGLVFGFLIVMGWTSTDSFGNIFKSPSTFRLISLRVLTAIFVCAFFVLSETMILVSGKVPGFGTTELLASIFAAVVCYLPIRLVLLIKSPVSWTECLSSFAAFGTIIWQLIQIGG